MDTHQRLRRAQQTASRPGRLKFEPGDLFYFCQKGAGCSPGMPTIVSPVGQGHYYVDYGSRIFKQSAEQLRTITEHERQAREVVQEARQVGGEPSDDPTIDDDGLDPMTPIPPEVSPDDVPRREVPPADGPDDVTPDNAPNGDFVQCPILPDTGMPGHEMIEPCKGDEVPGDTTHDHGTLNHPTASPTTVKQTTVNHTTVNHTTVNYLETMATVRVITTIVQGKALVLVARKTFLRNVKKKSSAAAACSSMTSRSRYGRSLPCRRRRRC